METNEKISLIFVFSSIPLLFIVGWIFNDASCGGVAGFASLFIGVLVLFWK